VICTDIECDGRLEGPNIELYQRIKNADPEISLIASGGVSQMEDIERLEESHLAGVIIGKALYEGKIVLKELLRFMS
jgi:phosphoribosylformimino-5-aminoimidazole carboxamide ribotide isomerase